jgi:hypothetical protein
MQAAEKKRPGSRATAFRAQPQGLKFSLKRTAQPQRAKAAVRPDLIGAGSQAKVATP